MSFQANYALRGLLATLALFSFAATPARAQASPGSIAGTVVDRQTGETLIGANVVLEGTTVGSQTDLNGRYEIRPVQPGTYRVVFSYIGYTNQTVTDVVVRAGQVTTLDLPLTPASFGLEEVTVTAEAVRNSEAGLLRIQARAPGITDGISAQQIRRSPDSNSGEALRRVTGVSVQSGKFVYVRGIPERYNSTLLNGTSVASTEPDRRAFAYDLLPANLLENVIISKSATPDLPGDFSGGLLQLNTVDFPTGLTASVSASGAYSVQTTGESFLSGPRGARDFLGLDDGTRALPGGFPSHNLANVPVDSALALARSLPNNWASTRRSAPVNGTFSATLGNTLRTGLGHIGVIGALSYRSSFNTSDIVRREYEGGEQLRFAYTGQQYGYNVSWGGLFNLAYRPNGFHSVSLKNLYTRVADDDYTTLSGAQFTDAGQEQVQYAMRFLSRSVYAGQLLGEHFFQTGSTEGLQLRWNLSRTFSTRNEPDYRRVYYGRDIGTDNPFALVIGPTVSLKTGGRFYSNMDEDGYGGGFQLAIPVGAAKATIGAQAETRDRSFESRLLGVVTPRRRFDFGLLTLPLDSIFLPHNFGPLANGREGFMLSESQSGSDDYTAHQGILAGFAMVDAPLSHVSSKLRFVGGLRAERSLQKVDAVGFLGTPIHVREPRLDLLPSMNLTYSITERTNARFAYSRNVNRPELRELAPFAYFDFELQTTIYGNDSLRQATINNFDLRFETYPSGGQMFSVSLFYKRFDDAIERVVVPGVALNAERSFANADAAQNFGVELESRFNLGKFSPYLSRSSFLANYTWVRSEVTVAGSSAVIPRTGRPLQGQSPYVINLGLNFVEPRAETSVSLLYNRLGSRIVEVASAFEDDVVELPRDVFDLVITQPVMGRYEIRLAARDLLNQEQRFTQAGQLVRSNLRGRSLSLGVSLRY